MAIASSAGGIAALVSVLGALQTPFDVPLLVVQHLDPKRPTAIATILARRTSLTVRLAEHGEAVEAGVVYVAPPDRHLLITPDHTIELTSTVRMNFLRPSADVLFESVATAYDDRAVAVVLTGTGTDGAKGVSVVKSRRGTVIVQDPEDAQFDGMPRAAIDAVDADYVLPLDEIGLVLQGLFELKVMDE